jgi:diguanylate cyclase (GGDEF)-like protein
MNVDELDDEWRRACRADDLLSRLDPPPPAAELVKAVGARICGTSAPPNPVLAGLASGHAAQQWNAAGPVLQLQVGLLVKAALGLADAKAEAAVEVHTVLSAACAEVVLDAWRNQAEVDALTDLFNRRRMELDVVAIRAISPSVTYANIDLDGLKRVNDTQGHEAGNEYIRQFAQALRTRTHSIGGTAYRHAGDEFLVVLAAGMGDLAGELAALRATEGVAKFSYGLAVWPDEDEDFEVVAKMADRRMYEMKRAGKLAGPCTGACTTHCPYEQDSAVQESV